jgi:drug/metabolite transporter (DMT)-like permease
MTSRAAPAMSRTEWLLLIGLSVLWGGTFFLVAVALTELPPFTVVFGRVSIAALALLALVYMRGQRMPRRVGDWVPLFVMALLNNMLPFSLIFWAQTQIPSGLASILNATTPLSTVILAHFLTPDERMTLGRVVGVLLGLGGVAVIIDLDALRGVGASGLAQLACLAATICYALGGIYGRRLKGTSPNVAAAGQLSVSAVCMLPIFLLVDRPWTLPAPSLHVSAAMLTLGLICTAAAYILYFRILATAGATNLLLVTLLIPVSALLLGIFILDEPIEIRHLAGMALIGIGLLVIDGRVVRALRRPLATSAD